MDTPELVLETQDPLADERNPSHALCSKCSQVKPIADFTRKPTPLQFKLWWGDLPYEKRKTYVGKDCNSCAKSTRRHKNTFDYIAYEETLRLDPKNHVLVPNRFKGLDTPKKKAPTDDYIPLYTALVWSRRMKGRAALRNARYRNVKDRQEPKYKQLIKLLRNERNRIKMRVANGCSEQAQEFCKAYVLHLVWLAKTIQGKRETTTEVAKESPTQYINDDRPETQKAKEAYRRLTSKDAEIVRPRFL